MPKNVLMMAAYDRTPQVQATQNATYVQAQQHAIRVWNSELQQNYDTWTNNHDDTESCLFDSTNVFNFVLNNPVQFGAQSDGASCYGKLPDCLWADDFHPGPALHKALAQAIAHYAGAIFGDFFVANRL
jgi:phospholipase/lecithinase/hemolysin